MIMLPDLKIKVDTDTWNLEEGEMIMLKLNNKPYKVGGVKEILSPKIFIFRYGTFWERIIFYFRRPFLEINVRSERRVNDDKK